VSNDSPFLIKRNRNIHSKVNFYKAFPSFAHKMVNDKDQSYTYFTIASVYVKCKNHSSTEKSFGRICGSYVKFSGSFENRFLRLLTSVNRKYIYDTSNLLGIVNFLAKNNIRINYIELFKDVYFWSESVKDRWARDFYRIPNKEESEE